MKKLLIVFIALITIVSTSLSVSAESELDANLDFSYHYDKESDLITVTASFRDIKDAAGIVAVEYDVEFDETVLELQSFNTNVPEAWQPFVGTEMFDDLSRVSSKDKGLFFWAIMTIEDLGVTEDDELYLTLVFKPIKKENTDIVFSRIHLLNINFNEISSNSSFLKINYTADGDTESISSPDNESITSSETDQEAPSISVSDVEQSSNGSVSGNGDSVDNDIDNGNNAPIFSVSDIDNTSDDTSSDNDDSGKFIMYVVVALVAVGGIGVIVFVSLRARKQGKGK